MRVIELFKELSSIPRCSGFRHEFTNYLKNFALNNNYNFKTDKSQNILITPKNSIPTLCLQSHYDMVCLKTDKENKNFKPIIYEEDGYLKAKNSTLGADNGIGCAYMLALIEENQNIEALFTSDEEIGLVGANNLELKINSHKILNLDSEEECKIFIGCAGGADIKAIFKHKKDLQNKHKFYKLTIEEQPGGHSGVDIDKNIPNAIKLLSNYIQENNLDIITLNAGERINSIPKFATAIISTTKNLTSTKLIHIEKLEKFKSNTIFDKKFNNFIYSFAHGVRGYDKELGCVLNSINLALINTNDKHIQIELSARSMDQDELHTLINQTKVLLENFGFELIEISNKYSPWKPDKNNKFASMVKEAYQSIYQNETITYEAIHAGLECAILKEKYPFVDIVSIGPNIYFPHSFNEEVEISSIIKVYEVIKKLLS